MLKFFCRVFFLFALSNVSNAAVITQLSDSTGLTLNNNFETSINNLDVTYNQWAAFGDSNTWSDNTTPSGKGGLVLPSSSSPLVGSISSYKKSLGMWFGNDDLNTAFNAILEIYSGSNLLGSVSLAANHNDKADQFIGLSCDTAFDSFHFFYQLPQEGMLAIYIDDIYFGESVSVPEPTNFALCLIGLFALVMRRKIKK